MDHPLLLFALAAALTLAAAGLGFGFARRLRADTGRPGDGFVLLIAIALGVAAVLAWMAALGGGWVAVGSVAIIVTLLPLAVLGIAGALVVNGVRVMKREGIGATTALPAAGGAALVLVPLATLWALSGTTKYSGIISVPLVILSLLSLYFGVHLLAYGAYAIAHARMAVPPGTRVVVTLGAGLRGDRVTPLLAGRLDRALAVRAAASEPGEVLMVTSGGQGADEVVSEADAMARYLREQGVPAERILEEDRSTTTDENLRYTRALLTEQGLADAPTVVATSDFHAVRTAGIARRLGWKVRVVGAPTAGYYRPAAALREFVALLMVNAKRHVIVAVLITVGILLLALM